MRIASGSALALLFAAAPLLGSDNGPIRKLTLDPDARKVELFAAKDEGLVTVKVIPQNEFHSNVSITNTTKEPLTIEVPKAVVAVHVLKQFGGQGAFIGLPGGTNNFNGNGLGSNQFGQGAGQSISGQFNNMPGQNGQKNFFNNIPGPAFFSIPAEKTVQIRLNSVCLDHGKPTPTAKMNYELRKLDQYTENKALIRLLESEEFRTADRGAAQAAAWNLSSGIPLERLANETVGTGVIEPLFATGQLARARELINAAQAGIETPAPQPASTRTANR